MSLKRYLGMLVAAVLIAGASFAPLRAEEEQAATSLQEELSFWVTDAENKLNELAEATPEDKYDWRPGEGVRSTREVFLHVAAANFGIPTFWGVAPPEGFKFDGYEQSLTKKADVRGALEDSFVHLKKALASATDEDLMKQVELFGRRTSVRGAYLLMLSHVHEHLGQSIAYARSNGIVPPWTARRQAAQKEKEAKEGAEN